MFADLKNSFISKSSDKICSKVTHSSVMLSCTTLWFIVNHNQWRSQKFFDRVCVCSIPFCPFPFSCPTKSAVQSVTLRNHIPKNMYFPDGVRTPLTPLVWLHHWSLHISGCRQFTDIHISQGSVATYLRSGGICKCKFVANLSLSLRVKAFWKSVDSWRSYGQEFSVFFWLTV